MAETLIAAAPFLSIAGTGLSAITGIMGAQQQSQQFAYRAAVDRNNAEQARINAAAALSAGEAEVQRDETQARRRAATAFAAGAASGVDPGYGSPLDLMADIAAEGALDTQIKRWRTRNTAQGYLSQGQGFAASAGMNDASASDAATAGPVRAATALLGGLGNYAMMSTRMGSSR